MKRPSRRTFLAGVGLSAAGLAVLGCGEDEGDQGGATQQAQDGEAVTIDFSQGDAAVVNFAYALEQLEAAFYQTVNDQPPQDFTDEDRTILEDIGAHEIAHRDFFKAKLGDMAIPGLEVDFSMVDFSSRMSVLQTAQTFEDLGVAAYNGAAQFISGGGPLGIAPLQAAGEIVSVEARHAAIIRDLLDEQPTGDFAPGAFDDAFPPPKVLEMANPFIATEIQLKNLPNQGSS